MSQLILDNQLNIKCLLPGLKKWIRARRLHDVRPSVQILDDRVPELLRTLKQQTFVTIDQGFWKSRLCDPGYCILFFALQDPEQKWIPKLLRAVLRLPPFNTRARHMGKVVRVSTRMIEYWEFGKPTLRRISWKQRARGK